MFLKKDTDADNNVYFEKPLYKEVNNKKKEKTFTGL